MPLFRPVSTSTLVAGTLVTLMLGACACPATSGAIGTTQIAHAEGAQLMLKLRDPATHNRALTTEEVATLAAQLNVQWVYVRQMSGGAHVLRLQHALNEAELSTLIARLNASAPVSAAALDNRMTHQ